MRKKSTSGGARIKKAGKHPFLLALTAELHQNLRSSATIEGRSVTSYILYHLGRAVRKTLRNPAD